MADRMSHVFWLHLLLIIASVVVLDSTLAPRAVSGPPQTPRSSRDGDPVAEQTRAGFPRRISRLAQPFPTAEYRGYYVGGGAAWFGSPPDAFHGENRRNDEGTFGVDYAPWYSNVRLHWFHGRKQQGGEGQYEPDERNNPFTDGLGFGKRSVHKHKLIGIQKH
jgi:hypothetical protein